MTSSPRRLADMLVAPTKTGALVAFRIALGALVTVSSLRFLAYGWVGDLFAKPTFFFKYFGFGWVKPLPASGMEALFVVLAVLGACFATGLFYRFTASCLFVLFAYVQLIDATNWLNHYYLLSLLLLLTSFMPLGRAGSVDALLFPKRRLSTFPAWCTYLLRFQVGVVYVYAGLAKATSDWLLHAQPLNIWLSSRTATPILGALFDQRVTAYIFSWSGFLFDTTIVGFLLWRRTRLLAYSVVVGFHLMTWLLFPIGMFPFIMMASALVFMDSGWPSAVLDRGRQLWRATFRTNPPSEVYSIFEETDDALRFGRLGRTRTALLAAYCLLQLLIPLRHRLYGGNVLWHEQGMRFSWKVMVREKNGSITYRVHSPAAGRTWYVEPHRYLTDRQERELETQPDLVLQLAHRIADDFRDRGHADVSVRVEALVSLNGRGAVNLIDPRIDLAQTRESFARATWILPEPQGPPIHLLPLKSPWPVPFPVASASGS